MNSNKIYISYFKTNYGELILGSFDEKLCLCDWRFRKMRDNIDNRIKKGLSLLTLADFIEKETKIIIETKKQLSEYFAGKRQIFELSILLVGTDFQKQVWEELLNIPFGQTNSYLALSKKLNNEKAIRAVASANGANVLSIIIPCHRIIGNTGELIGYAGGLPTKKKLLELENPSFDKQLNLF